MRLRSLACTAALAFAATALAQAPAAKPMPSPPRTTETTLGGATLKLSYNAPSMRGRKIMGGLVPYGQPWRTGANPATSFTTDKDIHIGTLAVPAGSYTFFTLPNETGWQFIVNKRTGEWGLDYTEATDLGRTPMTAKPMAAPQEEMSLTFENKTAHSVELHVKWETTDQFVTITLP